MRLNMKRLYCQFEKFGEIAAGVALLLIAILCGIAGFVILAPVVGLLVAIPAIAFSVYLFGTPASKACSF